MAFPLVELMFNFKLARKVAAISCSQGNFKNVAREVNAINCYSENVILFANEKTAKFHLEKKK